MKARLTTHRGNPHDSLSMETQDISKVPTINFTFIENFIKQNSKSSGDKEITKGFLYFSEAFVHGIRG